MRLFGSPFSPFARKVALVLDHKGLEYEYIDGGAPAGRKELSKMNARREVPVLDDDGLVVVNSADIVAYLDHAYPENPVSPLDPAQRVLARVWERLSDTTIDAILVDISLWSWAKRPDKMPEGMLVAARNDLDTIYMRLENELANSDYLLGEAITVADLALFPHLSATKILKVPISEERFPRLTKWLNRMFTSPLTQTDMRRLREYMPNREKLGLEMNRIAWRGDRLEWLLARGFHDWLLGEIHADRVIWPI